MANQVRAEKLARFFHDEYERLAPAYGYKTREESAKPFDIIPENHQKLMVAVAHSVLDQLGKEYAGVANDVADNLKEEMLWPVTDKRWEVIDGVAARIAEELEGYAA